MKDYAKGHRMQMQAAAQSWCMSSHFCSKNVPKLCHVFVRLQSILKEQKWRHSLKSLSFCKRYWGTYFMTYRKIMTSDSADTNREDGNVYFNTNLTYEK
jgi:hypothetical protein